MPFTHKRILGRIGLTVSRLGLASGYGISGHGVEVAFHDHGVNYFYWSTPRKSTFGDGLRSLAKTNRDDIVICLQSYDHLGITVRRSVTKGLKALGIDRADVILLGYHSRRPPRRVLDQARKLRENGLVRHIAMSSHNRKLFAQLAQEPGNPIDIFMIRYNAAHRGAETEIFPYLPEDNPPGITIYTATCWGKLLNPKKMPDGYDPMTAAECYRFVLSHPAVDLCMMGPRSEREMLEGLEALHQGPLSESALTRARKIGDFVHG